MDRGQLVLVDTCVIIEAFRTNCWRAVTTYFVVETVEKCEEEVRTGDSLLRPGYVKVDDKELRSGLRKVHRVSDKERAYLALADPKSFGLDDGERDLLAHAIGRKDAWLIVSADKAAVYATLRLGWRQRIISLESAAKAHGAQPKLKGHFGDHWLEEVCSEWTVMNKL